LATRRFEIEEIAKMFGIPASRLAEEIWWYK
jgi:hypothetical protein